MQKIVLAYSGSLGTSIAIPSLAEEYGAEVVTVTLDVGQGRELEEVRARALTLGAARAHVIDVREEFARRSVLAAFQSSTPDVRVAGAGALASLLAQHLADIARIEDTTMVAIGRTSEQAELRGLEPSLTIVATGTAASVSGATSRADRTLWGRISECASPREPSSTPARAFFQLTREPARSPDAAAQVEIAFARGVPVSINGVEMPLVELVQSLETIAGTHGVGRTDVTRPGADGSVRRTITEAPAAHVLDVALADLRRVATSVELAASAPAIRLQLFRGDCRVVGRREASVPTPAPQSGAARGVGRREASVPTPAPQSGAARGVGRREASVPTPAPQSGAARGVGVGPHAIKQSWPPSRRIEPALIS